VVSPSTKNSPTNLKPTVAVTPLVRPGDRSLESLSDSFDTAEKFDSFSTAEMSTSSQMDQSLQMFDHFFYRVMTKGEDKFEGALTRAQCFVIWREIKSKDDLYGIALIQIPERPFMCKFQLKSVSNLEDIPAKLSVKIDGNEYGMTLVIPKDPPPKLGEEFHITVKDTKFNVTLEQIDMTLGRFGIITMASVHIEADDVKGIKSDDALCVIKLRKHVPSFLPAFGRKLMIRYYGQPLQCSKCYNPGHLRRNCPNEPLDWLRYVRLMVEENILTLEIVGNWAEKIGLASRQNNSEASD